MPVRHLSDCVEEIDAYKTLEFLLRFLITGLDFPTDFLALRYFILWKINREIGEKDSLPYYIVYGTTRRCRWNKIQGETNHWILSSLILAEKKHILHLGSWDTGTLELPRIPCLWIQIQPIKENRERGKLNLNKLPWWEILFSAINIFCIVSGLVTLITSYKTCRRQESLSFCLCWCIKHVGVCFWWTILLI